MLTAEEARELSGPDSQDYLRFLDKKITSVAKENKRSIIIRDKPYANWLYNENKCTEAAKETLAILRDYGFNIRLYYKESQFVDMGLEISWEK